MEKINEFNTTTTNPIDLHQMTMNLIDHQINLYLNNDRSILVNLMIQYSKYLNFIADHIVNAKTLSYTPIRTNILSTTTIIENLIDEDWYN